jgi:hypothetical protein
VERPAADCSNRWAKKDEHLSSYWDWYLLGLVMGLGVTGMLTQLLRLGGLYGSMAYFIYWLHLIADLVPVCLYTRFPNWPIWSIAPRPWPMPGVFRKKLSAER